MKVFILLSILFSQISFAQENGKTLADVQKMVNDTLASKWYEKISLRGYAQIRYNRLFETNKDLTCAQCDKSIGNNQGLFLRRGRLIFSGEVNDKLFIYIQPDYGSDSAGVQNYFQIRDAYFDYALTENKDWRIRSGMSKVPFGFQNLQSSSNRAPLDRDDALNSALPNERDIGVYFMYSPTEIRKRFKDLITNNLKGSGDYGMFAIGAYNGQTLNRPERNNDLHRVVRLTYPFKLKSGQFIEASIQAYEGKFNTTTPDTDFYDQRSAASIIIYPQPLGFQAEYNVGQGPEFDRGQNTIRNQDLEGGYAMVNYLLYHENHRYFPFIRVQKYRGGKKLEAGAPSYEVEEIEFGTEWQPNNAFELTASYAVSDRDTRSGTTSTNLGHEKGQFLRLQAQFNY